MEGCYDRRHVKRNKVFLQVECSNEVSSKREQSKEEVMDSNITRTVLDDCIQGQNRPTKTENIFIDETSICFMSIDKILV